MGYKVIFDNIIFDEGQQDGVKSISKVESDLSFKFGAQLKSLKDVKQDMARKAHALNANCIMNFAYGQKARWLAIDDVAFYGKGIACLLPLDEYDRIVKELNEKSKN
jgi:hypothetical protein